MGRTTMQGAWQMIGGTSVCILSCQSVQYLPDQASPVASIAHEQDLPGTAAGQGVAT